MKKNEKSIKQVLFDEIDDPDNYDLEGSKNFLVSKGLDPGNLGKKGTLFFKKQIAKAKIKEVKRGNISVLEKAKQYFKKLPSIEKSSTKNSLMQQILGQRPELRLNYNKLEKIEEEDLLEMLDEVYLLKFIEETENNDSKNAS